MSKRWIDKTPFGSLVDRCAETCVKFMGEKPTEPKKKKKKAKDTTTNGRDETAKYASN